ncbi:hypothetical protein ACQZ61_21560 [Agrobacterium vitis]|uniref:hypothetical protein n=1 Tax=Agrobacterium vitis TaxID=373 RepID=UPI001113E8FD|nr:hypothetical protein [Agrobacterium vitis]MCF1455346.1 hypothetical protein [Agrobacterium vitis]MUO30983.1 hypothetical protein [Agrobacterium vitis]MUO85191.1 hypothetical protein [Agrobacterium vitis]
MADEIFEAAWKASEQIRDRVFSIDEFRMTPGMISNLANELSRQVSDMRVAFRRANKMANLELLESRIADLRKISRDLSGKISRLQSAAVGVHMDAYNLAHPTSN